MRLWLWPWRSSQRLPSCRELLSETARLSVPVPPGYLRPAPVSFVRPRRGRRDSSPLIDPRGGHRRDPSPRGESTVPGTR